MGVGSSKSIRCCERRCDEHPVTVIPPVEKSPLASATDEKLDEHGDDEPTDVVEDSPPVAEVVYEDDDPDPYTPVEEVGDPDECKARGNAHFKSGQLEKAYLAYGEAIVAAGQCNFLAQSLHCRPAVEALGQVVPRCCKSGHLGTTER